MGTCEQCELPQRSESTGRGAKLCEACIHLRDDARPISLTPLRERDLELVLAWRSHPDVYRHFREQEGPLEWCNHVEWFESREPNRHDFVIRYHGRRVGVVSLDDNDAVSIYIGEFSARGNGIAHDTLQWLCDRFSEREPLFAEVNRENVASVNLFEGCGFEKSDEEGEWLRFTYASESRTSSH